MRITAPTWLLFALAIFLVSSCWNPAAARERDLEPVSTVSLSPQILEFLRWLPADTETVAVTQVPIVLPAEKEWYEPEPEYFTRRVSDYCGLLPGYTWAKGLKLDRVVSGSRNFRTPTNMGASLFDGCSVMVIAEDSPISDRQIMQEASINCDFKEREFGLEILCFKKQIMDDAWTFYMCSVSPDIILWASDRRYLYELLARRKAKTARQAFLPSSELWRNLDVRSDFFALRDFRKCKSPRTYLNPTLLFEPTDGREYIDKRPFGYRVSYKYSTTALEETYISYDLKAQKIREYYQTHSEAFGHDLVPCKMAYSYGTWLNVSTDVSKGSRDARFILLFGVIACLGHALVV